MKKIYLLTFSLFALTIKAQVVDLNNFNYSPAFDNGNSTIATAIDKPVTPHAVGTQSTFSDYYDRSDTFMLPSYSIGPATLYLTGTSGSPAIIGVDYDNSTTVLIDELLVLYGAKVAQTGTKNYKAYIYNRGAALPTTVIDSASFSFSDINAPALPSLNSSYNFTSIPFSPAVSVAGNFVVAVEVDDTVNGNRDRVYLYTNDCLGDGNAEDRICMFPVPNAPKLTGGTVPMQWYSANMFYFTTGLSYVFDCDAMIIPIVQGETHTLSMNEVKGKTNGLTFLGHYPSPATETVKINYELEKSSKVVNLRIFDITGKTIFETNETDVAAGKHTFAVEVGTYAAGNFYYTLKTDDGKISSKFIVIK